MPAIPTRKTAGTATATPGAAASSSMVTPRAAAPRMTWRSRTMPRLATIRVATTAPRLNTEYRTVKVPSLACSEPVTNSGRVTLKL
jgi:hypothetical protein